MKITDNIRKYAFITFAIVCIAVASSALTKVAYLAYQKNMLYDVREFNASFYVDKKIGLAADSDELNFGITTPGGSGKRTIEIYHEYAEPLKIVVAYEGSISEVLKPIEPFILEPHKEENISLVAYAKNEVAENYTGVVRILLYRT
jgi:hypothetical protein